jgi:radical SAM superfamily enzyme YgiQ (UPF0313 family)
VSDHPDFAALARRVVDAGGGLSVSSFRAENLDAEALELLCRGGMKTVTVALESGGVGLRARIGKEIGEEDILRVAELARGKLPGGLRIYAMVGLPGEEDADVEELINIAARAKKALGSGTVTVSVSPFVPKPHTPFQWEPMTDEKTLQRRIRLLERKAAATPGLRVTAESPKWARVQGLLARGGREVGELLASLPDGGAWGRTLQGELARSVLDRRREPGEPLPWDFLAGAPARAHLLNECLAAEAGRAPAPCPSTECPVCGICG